MVELTCKSVTWNKPLSLISFPYTRAGKQIAFTMRLIQNCASKPHSQSPGITVKLVAKALETYRSLP